MVTKIYESATVVMYQGDALAAVDLMPREDGALLATDPPYGVRFQSNARTTRFELLAGDDGTLDVPDAIRLYTRRLFRVSGEAYVFGFAPEALASVGFKSTASLVWDKGAMGMGDVTSPWAASHEVLTYGVIGARKGQGALQARRRQGSVIRVTRTVGTQNRRHPTEKPTDLMRVLVETSSVRGGLVVDPFAGVGSTGVAAVLEGRRFIGVELDETYAAVAVERIKAAEKVAVAAEAL